VSDHEFKVGDKALHNQLGVVRIERVLIHGAEVSHPMLEASVPAPWSVLSPVPPEQVQEQQRQEQAATCCDLLGSLGALVHSGDVIGIVTIAVRADSIVASDFAGQLGDERRLVGELEFLKSRLIEAAR